MPDDGAASAGNSSGDSPTLPVSFASSRKAVRFDISGADSDIGDLNACGNGDSNWRPPVSPASPVSPVPPRLPASSCSTSSSSPSPPKLKVTMSFMKAYKAMRGPRDMEPSPLFARLGTWRERNGNASGLRDEEDPERGRLLNDVNDAIVGDGDDDLSKRWTRPFVRDSIDNESAARKTVFYFEQPTATPIDDFLGGKPLHEHGDDEEDDSVITDHVLDHTKMDQGWINANGPSDFDDEDPYVSDNDGAPSEARISPAVFRTLAAGCTLDDVDCLHQTLPEAPSLRPVTPQDKIMDVSKDTTRCNNVVPYCHRRQFDIHTGEELSPAYRVEPGPPSSVLWSPPGVTPERAGLYLLLLQEGQGEQQQPQRRHMRPIGVINFIVLIKLAIAPVAGTFRDSWHAIQAGQAANARLVAANEEAQAAITAQSCCLAAVEHKVELCHEAERARECHEAQDHYREQYRLEQQERQRAARQARQARKLLRRRQRILRGINENLHSLRTMVGETEARLARGRELRTVLAQRLRDGEARLQRLCRDHGVADVAALSEVLTAKMAQLGVEEEE
ncbi:hypothetical protein SCUCBS95973_007710 [Sporothrix curviconia]|uniref:Uncharacterized protein n=1 Tax=Sporothrix curviconia TaxID=1260050 RepID=A0ABP0CIE1_9PEZI